MSTSMSSRIIFAGVSLLLFLAQPTAARADRIIDTFRNPLATEQVNCTSLSGPYLWAGTTYPWVSTHSCMQSYQSLGQAGLSEVVGGRRSTTVSEPTLSNFVLAYLANGELNYSTAAAPSGILTLEYGVGVDLNLNVSGDSGFYLRIDGQLSNSTPVLLTVTIKSSGKTSSYAWYLTGSAPQYLPFANFSGVNWSDVDYLQFEFDSSKVKGMDYTLSNALTINGQPCGLCTVR